MKRIVMVLTLFSATCLRVFAQCPDPNITVDGFHPSADSVACVERGLAYSQAIQANLPASIVTPLGNITVTSLTINSITGAPTGITTACNPTNCTFAGGTSGCIDISGTTNEPAGVYNLTFNATIVVEVPFLGSQTFTGDIDSLVTAIEGFGVSVPFLEDIDYYLNVIEQGAACVLPLSVSITGETVICPGDQTTLEAVVENGSGNEIYEWSTGDTGPQIVPPDTGTYTVQVIDNGDTATATVTVTYGLPPVAGFTGYTSSLRAFFNNTTQGDSAVTYSWDFGDGQSSTDENPYHDYAAAGTYTVILNAVSSCGDDFDTLQVTVAPGPCTANPPTGNGGVFPSPDSIPCVERNTPFDFTMHVENFDALATLNIAGLNVAILVDSTRIDSVANLPCGISWEADKLFYLPEQVGCIKVSGTSKEVVGQYPLQTYMTLWVRLIVPGVIEFDQSFSGELSSLVAQLDDLSSQLGGPALGFDYKYVSRVIELGETNCPARDTSATAPASGTNCPAYRVDVTGSTIICTGSSTTLTAEAKYYDGAMGSITYSWSNGATTKDITIDQPGSYSVTVSDVNGATVASQSVNVTEGTAPTAGFVVSVDRYIATITQNTTTGGATSYSWNWGDSTPNSSGQIPPPHTYTANGNFTITLTATNVCGSNTATQQVTTTGVFIAPIENNLEFDVYPNPSTGFFNLTLTNNDLKPVSLRIFDLTGKLVYTEQINEINTVVKRQIDLSVLPKGVYSLHLSSEAGNGIQRLTIY